MAAAQTAAESFAAASVGAALASFGLTPDLLAFALVGAGAWVLLSSSMARRTALACALFSVPVGTILGHWLGVRAASGDLDMTRILTFVSTAALVPVLRGLIGTLERRSAGMWDAAADRAEGSIKGTREGDK